MTEEALRYVGLVRNITSKYNFRSDYDDLFLCIHIDNRHSPH